MPLLKRKPYTPGPLIPPDLSNEEEVFVVRHTGQVVRDYEEYLALVRLYQSRVWVSMYTGKSNLTYEEAVADEQKSTALLQKFPQELEKSVAEKVQFSTSRLEELVNNVYDAHRPAGKPSGKENEPEQKQKHPLPRPVIKRWILEVAELKNGLWFVNSDLTNKYSLPTEPPHGLLLSTEEPAKKKPKRSSGASSSASPSPAAKAQGSAEHEAVKSEAAAPPQPPKPPRTWEEDEVRLKAGTTKHAAFAVMKKHAPAGVTVAQIIAESNTDGVKTDWGDSSKTTLQGLLIKDPIFVRVAKGLYSLYGYPGVVPVLALPPKPRKQPAGDQDGQPKVKEEGGSAPLDSQPLEDARASIPPSGGEAASAEQQEAAAERDALRVAQRVAAQAQMALEQYQKRLQQASDLVAELKPKAEAAAKVKTPVKKAKDASAGMDPMPQFELAEEFRAYTGPENDRKAILAWKKRADRAKEQLVAEKDAWIAEQKAKMRAARSVEKAGSTAEARELAAAQSALEDAQQEHAAAARAMAEAQRNVDREKQRVALREARDVQRAEREKARAAERELRERRRQEALEARRYPIDDSQLMEELGAKAKECGDPPPPLDVAPLPEPLPEAECHALSTRLFVLDLVSQMSKPLGLKPLSQELEAALGGSAKLAVLGEEPLQELGTLAQAFMQVLLDDLSEAGAAGRLERRWSAVLGPATWPEVLRRYIVSRAGASGDDGGQQGLVAADVLAAARLLGQVGVEELLGSDVLLLLRFLCDEALDTEMLRSTMESRLDKAAEAAADMRQDMAEDRKKLREIIESEKEARKRKREEALAVAAAAAVAAGAAEAEAAEGAAPGPAAKKAKTNAAKAAAAQDSEEEPSFELPADLVEYTGAADDRKAQLMWRQQQQAALKELDKAKARWQGEKRRRELEKEAIRRAEMAEERRKQKEREDAEEALIRRQELYEKDVEKLMVRRAPLGSDRHHRRYWWGVAGCKAAVWVEDCDGRWAAISTQQNLEALMESLDKRGVRELELHRSLEKYHSAITSAMRRAAREREGGAGDKAAAPAAPAPAKKAKGQTAPGRLQPSRGAKKPDAPQEPSDKPQEKQEKPATPTPSQGGALSVLEEEALQAAVASLNTLALAAAAALTAPSGGWKSWRDGLRKVLEEAEEAEGTGPAARSGVCKTLQARMLELEGMLVAATRECEEEGEEEGKLDGSQGQDPESGEGSEGEGQRDGRSGRPQGSKDAAGPSADDDEEGRQARAKRRLSHGHHGPSEMVSEDAEEVASDSEVEDQRRWGRCLWGSGAERASWCSCVAAAVTGPRLAYCAAVLEHAAEKPLQALTRTKKRKAT